MSGTIPGTRKPARYSRLVDKQQANPSAPEVRPLEVPMVPFAVIGMAVWAVLGLLLLGFHGWVSAHGHNRWTWTCLAGVLWGLPGLYFMYRHDRRRRTTAEPGQ
jgi:hypothetical protein